MAIKILVVEDEKVQNEFLCTLLSREGYEVRSAFNGLDALNIMVGFLPNLILSDIKMDRMDGYEFLQAVRRSPAFVRISFIFISAKAEMADIRLGMNLGADDYLVKPFHRSDLFAAIKMRLKRKDELINEKRSEVSEPEKKKSVESEKVIRQIELLTPMEKKIVHAISQGMTTVVIADKLFLSPKTVENHRYNIAKKLNLKGTNSVLAFALKHRTLFKSITKKA